MDMDVQAKKALDYVNSKIWFLEYSPKQKCFHVDSIDRILAHNRDGCLRGNPADYFIIDGPYDHDGAFRSIHKWINRLPYNFDIKSR